MKIVLCPFCPSRMIGLLVLICGMSVGCRQTNTSLCDTIPLSAQACDEALRSSTTVIMPAVVVTNDDPVLTTFCDELATALLQAGALQVVVETEPAPTCAEPLGFQPPLQSSSNPSTAATHLYVTVRDFRAYRPMRIGVDVRVIDTSNDAELARIGDIFYGAPDPVVIDLSPVRRLRSNRRRSRHRDPLETIRENSPRWFLADVAQSVADQLIITQP